MFSVGFRFRGRIEFPVIDIAEPSIEEPIPEWEQGATRARIADVRQAREDPMGALPLGVGVSDAVSNAWPNETREERANSRRTANPPLEGVDSRRRAILSEDLNADLPADRRFLGGEQPLHQIDVVHGR